MSGLEIEERRDSRHSHAAFLGRLAIYRKPAYVQDAVKNDESDIFLQSYLGG